MKRGGEPFAGTWHLPSGFVEYGEHPALAAEREFREETGLKANAGRLVEMLISKDDPREPGHLALFFEMTDAQGSLANDDKENLSIAWFPLDELPVIALANHALAVRTYVDHFLGGGHHLVIDHPK